MKKLVIWPLVVILIWLTFDYINYNFHTVIDGEYYRSAQLDSAKLASIISKYNIATVINLRGSSTKREWHRQEVETASELNIKHVDIRLNPMGLPQINTVKELVDLIKSQEKPILFHCKQGADRSGLASAIALLLEHKKITEIEEQVSWRYQAIDNNSTGKLFIKQYHDWLIIHKTTHTPAVFIDWLSKDYVDDKGNMLFTLERVNDMKIAGNYEDIDVPNINIDRANYKTLQIVGWTIDYVGQSLPKHVQVLFNNKPLTNMQTEIPRPDVVKVFGHPNFMNSGWRATEKMNDLENGCYVVQLVFTMANHNNWISDPKVKVCING